MFWFFILGLYILVSCIVGAALLSLRKAFGSTEKDLNKDVMIFLASLFWPIFLIILLFNIIKEKS